MDTPRRWQVASLATAVASLGVGGMLLGRPAVDEVAAIDLDHLTPSSVTTDGPSVDLPVRGGPEIVEADVIGVSESTAATVATATSITSAEDPSGGDTRTGSQTTAPAAPVEPVAPPEPAAPADSVDSPDSIDSASSLDS